MPRNGEGRVEFANPRPVTRDPRMTAGRSASMVRAAMIKFLHTRIRVADIEASVDFYKKLGYTDARRQDSPQGNKLAFLELPGNDVFLELCYSPDYTSKCPEDLMHTCLGVPDIIEYCDSVEKAGIEIWPGGWREKFSSGERKMAFVTDPDGYEVEILERE